MPLVPRTPVGSTWVTYAVVGRVEDGGKRRPYRLTPRRSQLVMIAGCTDDIVKVRVTVIRERKKRR